MLGIIAPNQAGTNSLCLLHRTSSRASRWQLENAHCPEIPCGHSRGMDAVTIAVSQKWRRATVTVAYCTGQDQVFGLGIGRVSKLYVLSCGRH